MGLNPGAVDAMKDIGVDISRQRSKHVAEFLSRRFDYVITVCDRAKESCPIFHGAGTLLHWSFTDPAAVEGTEAEREKVFPDPHSPLSCSFVRPISADLSQFVNSDLSKIA